MSANTYDIINNKILELLEGGTIPWHKPWNSNTSMPKNLVSKKEYKGVNVFLLACNEFSSPWYLTSEILIWFRCLTTSSYRYLNYNSMLYSLISAIDNPALEMENGTLLLIFP